MGTMYEFIGILEKSKPVANYQYRILVLSLFIQSKNKKSYVYN